MNSSLVKLAVCVIALALSGCVGTKAYIESGHDKADYRELQPRNPPTQVKVVADFRVNGQPRPIVNNAVLTEVVHVLQRTNVLRPVSGTPKYTLTVTVDDLADLDTISTSALITGLTEGLTGTVSRDDYRFSYSMTGGSGPPLTGLYHHAMITVAGRAAPPSYGQPHNMNEAFSIIVKQSVLEYLHDIQGIDPDNPVMLVPDSSDHP
jgi:hypothetical protein